MGSPEELAPQSPGEEIDPSLVARLLTARSTVFLTGAGASAESGIPTFRDAMTGLWSRYSPEKLASPAGFAEDAALVWKWYAWRREIVSTAEPNPGHRAIRDIQSILRDCTLVTQNVDGLHQRAGSDPVIELHGSLFENICSSDRSSVDPDTWIGGEPPTCPRCGARVRPGVVWFGEMLPESALKRSRAAAAGCDVFFSVGTSSLVYPAAELAEIALRSGAVIVEINPEPTPLTGLADYVIAEPSALALPRIRRALGQSKEGVLK